MSVRRLSPILPIPPGGGVNLVPVPIWRVTAEMRGAVVTPRKAGRWPAIEQPIPGSWGVEVMKRTGKVQIFAEPARRNGIHDQEGTTLVSLR
jgi:hypothetical protein